MPTSIYFENAQTATMINYPPDGIFSRILIIKSRDQTKNSQASFAMGKRYLAGLKLAFSSYTARDAAQVCKQSKRSLFQ